jgi:EAL and modified HD-GYP domain-containing signal transduction protein
MDNFLIGRQQILDSNLNTVAYEILFRGTEFDISKPNEAYSATNQVITDILLEIGLQNITGNAKAFINFTEQHLLDKIPCNLPKDRIVIEVLENVSITPQLVSIIKNYAENGFTIALDDFILSPEWKPLLEIANIIKLDILQMPMEKTLGLIEQLQPYNLTLLAEKVETREDYNQLKDAGCELFQGYFFNKPETIKAKRQDINQNSLLRLLATINKPDVSFDVLSQIISQDPHLTLKLLNYVNSSFFSFPQRINSIPHAVSVLGLNELKRWINILTLSSVSDKPVALMQNILVRAKMSELIAEKMSLDINTLFLNGLLSGIDALLDTELQEILKQLPLNEKIIDAILYKHGEEGKILDFVLRYERWENLALESESWLPADINQIYLQSIEWSNQVLNYSH